MKKRVERLRGMYDILPAAHQQQRWVIEQLTAFLARAGYVQVDTPVLERSDLFEASFGQESWHKLYSFRLHHRDLCLRPEFTAALCRLYLDHYQQQPLPLRFQYAGPIFRHEVSEQQLHRQNTQFGVELFGGDPFATDAEILHLACDILHELHISRYRLELGHIGVVSNFIKHLQLDPHAARLLLSLMEQISRSEEGERLAQERLEALYPPDPSLEQLTGSAQDTTSEERTHYVSSLLDGISISFSDDNSRGEIVERFLGKMARGEQRRQVLHALEFLRALHAVSGAPPEVFHELRGLLDRYHLGTEPLTELERLVAIVEEVGVPREQIMLNLSLGRGVSYYTGLVFEIHAQEEDGETQLCGGGRYDHLLHAVGSPHNVNACGFAFDVERLLSRIPQETLPALTSTHAIVIPVSAADLPGALQIARTLRGLGIATELDVTRHGLAASLKAAAKRQIPLALLLGENERRDGAVTVHDLVKGVEQLVPVATLARHIQDQALLLPQVQEQDGNLMREREEQRL